jgi:hypothetical protein
MDSIEVVFATLRTISLLTIFTFSLGSLWQLRRAYRLRDSAPLAFALEIMMFSFVVYSVVAMVFRGIFVIKEIDDSTFWFLLPNMLFALSGAGVFHIIVRWHNGDEKPSESGG